MSTKKTKEELFKHKQQALDAFSSYLDSLINSDEDILQSKSDKLCYWIKDWCNFLSYEPNFIPSKLRRYKRGEIVKVHLGFNIGSEEGGLHYAIVLDKNNSIHNPVLTIVPLTSIKPSKDISNLRNGEVYLGNELFTNLSAKYSVHHRQLSDKIKSLETQVFKLKEAQDANKENSESYSDTLVTIEMVCEEITCLRNDLALLQKMKSEINKMKQGSIALTNQITTISKIRIYDPKTNHDVLSNIKLSNDKLDLIDETILTNFSNKILPVTNKNVDN